MLSLCADEPPAEDRGRPQVKEAGVGQAVPRDERPGEEGPGEGGAAEQEEAALHQGQGADLARHQETGGHQVSAAVAEEVRHDCSYMYFANEQ